MDELEREDFTRLKMVKKKKEIQIKTEEKAKVARGLALEQTRANLEETNIQPNVSQTLKKIESYLSANSPPGKNASSTSPSPSASASVAYSTSSSSSPSPRASLVRHGKSSIGTASASGASLADLADDEDDIVFK